ncbi:hypothetical protein JCGZ_15299 [Jatropha curcas]|uniref:PHD-type domain-containing protein n=1 Tax=Jatropha curcas TaxID=180498 RepID=A0A067LM42_JATCU|nr:uncharacterized protein LOC105637408 [Jatropha curcas]KDP45855.1 hypothetical protein JCGZ_15299 [Jatropha curcas]
MQLKSASVSSPKPRDFSSTGSRLRKKHKRLDAICENVYNQNHSESNERRGGSPSGPALDAQSDLRRSSRVRRAPVVLDVSPPPVKKRKKIGKNVASGVNRNGGSSFKSVKEEESEKLEDLDTPGNWRSRLRSRGRNVATGERGETSGRRKLFDEMDTVGGELAQKKGDLDGEKLMVVRSKRLGRVKAVNGLPNEMNEGGTSGHEDVSEKDEGQESIGKNESEKDEMEVEGNEPNKGMTVLDSEIGGGNGREAVGNEADEHMPVLVDAMGGGNEGEAVNGDAVSSGLNEPEQKEKLLDLELEKSPDGNDNVEQNDKIKELEDGMDVENETDVIEVIGPPMEELKDPVKEGGAEVNEFPLEVEKDEKPAKLKHDLHTLARPRIKQGRRCGLCGCGNDGKPPKRLMQDAGESENETYSGSSASEDPNYDVWDGFGDEPGWLGRLLGPINDRHGIAGIWVHQHCAVWSPEVYFAGLGCLKNVRAALCRGRALKCTRCGRPGATIGCRVDRCPKTYHLPCARANSCIFDHRKFLIACTDHRHLFQPHGNQYAIRIKKLKARKMRLEIRKRSNDAWRKDIEAEEKWLENCGEDEEFLKRESKRLHRDLLRIAPVYIGGSGGSDSAKLFEGWESVAGLKDVIQCMKEVVILPLLYPEFFNNLGITPPRGVLLHGYPGTGKTLVVRALIGSCSRGDKRIAYFARKGADCLGKYVGDAERQLRLLFQVAERCQPSIIFFDEIDGLAPSRTRQQDQTHSSVVSTLLALMDGLKSRGSVVVIGATNRPEAVDPALRRPGRFDREIYFPLPSVEDRAAILLLHTQRWPKPVAGSLLQWVARRTVGFAGADLQALCTQAAIIALKRNFPLQEILSAAGERAPGTKRIPLPAFEVEDGDWLEALACAPPPCSRREAGIAAYDLVSSPLPGHLIPCLLQPLSKLLVTLYLDERLWLPPPLFKAALMVKTVIVSFLKKRNLPSDRWWCHVDNFLEEAEIAKQVQGRLSSAGVLIGEASCAGADTDVFADEKDDDKVMFEPSMMQHWGTSRSTSRIVSFASVRKSGYRVLIAGGPRSGQKQLASCILHFYVGNVEVQKVDLATISQEGHDDMVQGITQILMKCASLKSSMIFMPRIDLWAVEACQQVIKESDASSTDHQLSEKTEFCSTPIHVEGKKSVIDQCGASEVSESQTTILRASHAWSSFIEQVETICVSTSLIILATSELPYQELPNEIRQFFKNDISNSGQLTPLEHSIPRFLVHVGGNFNRDVVVSLSAAKLLRDMIQLFVLSVHQRLHIHTITSKEYKFCDSIQGCDTDNHNKRHGSAGESECREEFPCDHSKVIPPPNNRSLKGKSSLLLAISTFGYQILRYPHFAELCWVTSKLNEGPCADVAGPWKGWPFNSCIIRPGNIDSVIAASCSGNVKSKERFGMVRGLIAVGLSAYRGVYKSLREVAFEVRKVLELLVQQVNEKIQAGKDKYQYVRLLSQVAYLEDVVNSWAHALQSLELSTQMPISNAGQNTIEFPGNQNCLDNSVQSEDCKAVIPDKSSHKSERLERSAAEFIPESVESNKGDNGFLPSSSSEVREVPSEDMLAQQIVVSGHTKSDEHLQSSTTDSHLIDDVMDEQNMTTLGQCKPKNTENLAVATELDNKSSKYSDGFMGTEAILPSKDGLCNSSRPCSDKISDPVESCGQINGLAEGGIRSEDAQPSCSVQIGDINFVPGKTSGHSVDSGIVCSYSCCSGCLCTLHELIQKILVHEWGLNKSYWTAEDVHDVVSSFSVDLLSAIRKVDKTKNISNSLDENLRFGSPEILSEHSELHNCHCRSPGNTLVMALECSCHCMDGSVTAKGSNSSNSHLGLQLEFIFRDGILVPVDSNMNVSFHCKYETLCLCSLIESVLMIKKPFD